MGVTSQCHLGVEQQLRLVYAYQENLLRMVFYGY